MKYYIITRSEMELLEKAGLAVVACPKTKSGYDWSGVVSYLGSEDGDKIKLAPIRYTKKLAIKGYDDVEKIMKNTFHKGK